jgi:very-short-patch-repair endonuclease
MSLEDKIIEVLNEGKPLKGREIAELLVSKYGVNVDKSEVNSALYRKLHGVASQNKNYQWSLKTTEAETKKKVDPSVQQSTPLAKLCYYYLECLSKDMEGGISVYARSKYLLEYTQLNAFPGEQNAELKIDRHLIEKIKGNSNGFVFKFGYPMLVRKLPARQSGFYFKAEPLFVFSVDTEFALQNGSVRLTDDEAVLNPEALKATTGIQSASELMLEIVDLYEELGMNNDPDDKPGVDEMLLRLQQLKENWLWKEEVNSDKLSTKTISTIDETGIYNSAAVFVAEKSKYTAGLEKDLKDLSKLPEEGYQKSALGAWINNVIGPSVTSDQVLIEPISLNEEQREAILKGLSSPLTVVTGPPGTGKSQVVASLIVNAVYHGQTVLFSSKNNKAVDVVSERVNALTNRQVMLRMGSGKLQGTLAEYLSNLLSARPSVDDKNRYTEALAVHETLLQAIGEIKKNQDRVVTARNKVDALERNLEPYREELGASFFASCEEHAVEKTENIALLLSSVNEVLNRADKTEQSFIVKLLWSFICKSRFAAAKASIDNLRVHVSHLQLEPPLMPVDDSSIQVYRKYVQNLVVKNSRAKEIKEYFTALKNLSQGDDLFKLSVREKEHADQVVSNSVDLWNYWLQLLPIRMSQEDRKIIGDYVAVLNLIVTAETSNQRVEGKVWAKYYSFLPKITHILSCWAVTSLSARGRVPLEAGFFDLVIIDEASQCDIASVLPLLFRAKRAVIIGDDKQLTHITSINEMQDTHLLEKYDLQDKFMSWSYSATSLYQLATSLSNIESIVTLRDHHRSHADIIGYSNKHFYEGGLRVATKYENLKPIPNEPAVRWIDVKGKCIRPETGSSYNDREAEEVVKELARLVATGYKGSIGVVTPFHAQAVRIMDKLRLKQDLADRLTVRNFLCDTVHKFQGDERDVMIFSSVVSDGITEGAVSFLDRTGKLFNVAITRARAALILVGDKQACHNSRITHYKGFVEYLNTLEHAIADPRKEQATDLGAQYPKVSSKVIVSDWEKKLYEGLYQAGIKTTPQHLVGQYFLDLALFDGDRKLNIEIDGEKYHRNWDGELMRRDQLRNKRLIELGWDVQRFWVYQIRDNMQQCIEKIEEWKRC